MTYASVLAPSPCPALASPCRPRVPPKSRPPRALLHVALPASDSAPSPPSAPARSKYLSLYFTLGLVSIGVQLLRSFLLILGSIRASRLLARRLLDKVVRLPMSFFDQQPTGEDRQRGVGLGVRQERGCRDGNRGKVITSMYETSRPLGGKGVCVGGMEAAWRRHGGGMEAAWRRHGGRRDEREKET